MIEEANSVAACAAALLASLAEQGIGLAAMMNPGAVSNTVGIALIALLSLNSALRAADNNPPGSVCVSVDEDAARLACYDQAFGRAAAARVAAADPPGGSFGFTESQKRVRDAVVNTQTEAKSMEATVSALALRSPGRLSITLDNGQVWAQSEAGGDSRLSIGDRVTIRRAALGSFLLQHGRSLALRVSRIR
jgi:hypothetical protein